MQLFFYRSKSHLNRIESTMPDSIASEVVSASLGGAISASILYPSEVLKTKMQAETKKAPSSPSKKDDDAKDDAEEEED